MGGEAQVAQIFACVENLSDHTIAFQLPRIGSIPGKARNSFPLKVYDLTAFKELLLYLNHARYRYTVFLSKLVHHGHVYEKGRESEEQAKIPIIGCI